MIFYMSESVSDLFRRLSNLVDCKSKFNMLYLYIMQVFYTA